MQVGDKAVEFTLKNQDNIEVSLRDFASKWVVLYFYPKDDTPGCTTEACEFTNEFKDFVNMDAMILGVSADSPEKHSKFIQKYSLKVTLLSDSDKSVMIAYDAYGEKMMYGKACMGVKRSTYLINPEGKIAHIWKNVKAKGHAEAVKAVLANFTHTV
jgi:peroxiredoxin Q/BCP